MHTSHYYYIPTFYVHIICLHVLDVYFYTSFVHVHMCLFLYNIFIVNEDTISLSIYWLQLITNNIWQKKH